MAAPLRASAEFSLRDLVREVAEESAAADPTELAAEVLWRIPRAASRAALEEALRLFVRDFIRVERSYAATADARQPAPSARVAGVRDAWKRMLAARISVGGEWKFLADATADDWYRDLAGELDLPDWPVYARSTDAPRGDWWKLDAVRRRYDRTRPLIWADDDLRAWPEAARWCDAQPGRVLGLSVSPYTGLTPRDFASIRCFAGSAAEQMP